MQFALKSLSEFVFDEQSRSWSGIKINFSDQHVLNEGKGAEMSDKNEIFQVKEKRGEFVRI